MGNIMTETLSFPGLGLEFELSRVAFTVGNFPIYWYGITFALAFLVGYLYFQFRAKKIGIHPNTGFDVVFWAIIGGMIGARLYYVVFQWEALYAADPMKVFSIREGGLAIYGGVIGAIAVGLLVCKIKKVPILPMLDIGMPALLLGQAIGRWGNFFNIEAFGGNTDMPWGMTSTTIENFLSRPDIIEGLAKLGQTANPFGPVHPTFFYEFVWNIIGFMLLAFVLTPRRKYDGQVMLGYMAWYGLGRGMIEGLRTDSLVMDTPLGMIRVSQYLAIILCVFAVITMIVLAKKRRSENRPAWLGLYSETQQSKDMIIREDVLATGGKRKKACPMCNAPANEPCDCFVTVAKKKGKGQSESIIEDEEIIDTTSCGENCTCDEDISPTDIETPLVMDDEALIVNSTVDDVTTTNMGEIPETNPDTDSQDNEH